MSETQITSGVVVVVSHHFLRRTARNRAADLNRRYYGAAVPKRDRRYRVQSYVRGPFGFKVVDTGKPPNRRSNERKPVSGR